jgi:cytochrome c oxidase subunit 2
MPSWLAPAGPAAAAIAELAWWLFALGALVYAAVVGAGAWALWRASGPRAEPPEPGRAPGGGEGGAAWLMAGAAGLTLLVVAGIAALNLGVLRAVLPAEARPPRTVEVVGHQWWWSVRYLGRTAAETVESANELHVPVGRRVGVRLLASDVIHSFWVPQLHGKLDLVPGKLNVTWIQADRPGVYQGFCAEYCGLQHARMLFLVVAHPPDEFEEWLRREREPAGPPAGEAAARGARLFIERGCGGCHAVRGLAAALGVAGPDLTHVASRRTLGGGALSNVGGHLAGWIADPQGLKPGNRMPRVGLEADELHAVLSFVGGLR